MREHNTADKNQSASPAEWMTMMTDFWSPIMNTLGAGMQQPFQPAKDPTQDHPKDPTDQADPGNAAWQTTLQMWRAMMKLAGEPMGMAHQQQTAQVVPDMVMGFAQTCMRGFMHFQSQVNQWMEKKDSASLLKNSEAFKKECLQGWTDLYEKEFRQYFNIPQIGMGRVYQERMLHAADKHNLFQGALTKFLHQLYQPMEEAFEQLQQQVAEHAESDQLEEDPKAYYHLWVKLLEARYMTLFKQSDFSEILGQTLGALNEYSLAKQGVVNDLLKQATIPTHDDLDDLYKEIHLLKKRMRNFEKQ
jgi:polyhydroxyalkanoate synthase subunit PhaE